MANGYSSNIVVGTTEILAVPIPEGMIADVTIQNLSANDLYFGVHGGVSSTTGMKISANGSAPIEGLLLPLSLIASAASSDVRLLVQFYKKGEK